MRILIAEDDAVSRRVLQRCVAALGHECLVAEDGEQAWACFQRERVDVVVSDWMMPRLDGPALCRRIREGQADRSAYPYLVLLTSLSDRAHYLSGMQAGADDYLLKPLDPEALRVRLIAAERVTGLHRRLAEQAIELQRLNERLYEEGRTDGLTRLRNRLALQEDLRKLDGQSVRYGYNYAVAMCDIDHYKRFNDHYGHQAGDEALKRVARALAGACRESDTVYRYGGEEFLVLLPEQSLSAAARVMDRLRAAVADMGVLHAGAARGILTLSVGVSARRAETPTTTDSVLREADEALYRAKAAGRDTVAVYREGECHLWEPCASAE